MLNWSGMKRTCSFALVGCKQFVVTKYYMAFTTSCKCLYGGQRAPSKTNRQVIGEECSEDAPGKTRNQLIYLQCKNVIARTPPVGFPSSRWDSLESVAPILTQIQQSLWYADKKKDSLPLRPIVWRSRMMPYCRVVPYPFSKLKKRPTVCCLCAKASQIYLSRLTRWFILWQCFLKPHWLLFIFPDFSRYQMKRVLYQLA